MLYYKYLILFHAAIITTLHAQPSIFSLSASAFRAEDQKKEKTYSYTLDSKVIVKEEYSLFAKVLVNLNTDLGFIGTKYDDVFIWLPTKNKADLELLVLLKDNPIAPALSNSIETAVVRHATYARGKQDAKAAFMDPYIISNALSLCCQYKSPAIKMKFQPGISYLQIYSKDFTATTDNRATEEVERAFAKYSWEIKSEVVVLIDSNLTYRDKFSFQQTFDKAFRQLLRYSGTFEYTIFKSLKLTLSFAATYDSFISRTIAFSQTFGVGAAVKW